MQSEIQERLEQLAFKRTNSFCYSCYQTVTESHCPTCGTDDFMRELPGVGVEYGISWVIREILSSELEAVDIEGCFEQSICDCYPEDVTVGWMNLDTISVMKEMDPTSWNIAQQEWADSEEQEENIISFDNGSTYYWTHDIKKLLHEEGL